MDGRTAAAVLGITQGATRDEIRRAFRARAKLVHPDAHGTDEAFVTLRAAADLLLAAAPERPGRRAAPGGDHPAPVDGPVPAATIAPGDGAATPATAPDGPVGRRTACWMQRPANRPGAAIDLTDHPTGTRCRPTSPATAEAITPEAAAAAFARVLGAELARH